MPEDAGVAVAVHDGGLHQFLGHALEVVVVKEHEHGIGHRGDGQADVGVQDAQLVGHQETVDDDRLGGDDRQGDHQRDDQPLALELQHAQGIADHAVDDGGHAHIDHGHHGGVLEELEEVHLLDDGHVVVQREFAHRQERLEGGHVGHDLGVVLQRGHHQIDDGRDEQKGDQHIADVVRQEREHFSLFACRCGQSSHSFPMM